MKVLYVSYSCSPNHGSEDRIGWKIPLASAENNKVFVITKEEHRSEIEEFQKQHPDLQVEFYYVDIPSIYKRIFRGFAYSGRLNIWNRRAVALAEQLCLQENIDIIHQITPVEFRSIGDYGRIPNIKFVCGPIGGGEYIPPGLRYYARWHIAEEILRAIINRFGLVRLRCSGILSRCDAVLFANEETKRYVSSVPCNGKIYNCMTEIGIDADEIIRSNEIRSGTKRNFLVAGRLIYRKGHEFLLDTLKELPAELDYTCTILGSGPETNRLKKKCHVYGLESHVQFRDKVPFSEMGRIYADTHVLIMPSIRETTGSVLLEAMAKSIPIVTIDRFGGAELVNEDSGWLYFGRTRKEYIDHLKKILISCITESAHMRSHGVHAMQVCALHVWDKKAAHYQEIYTRLVQKTED